ncbi:fatty acyl-CoA hydrolase precursor, medium chain-like [Alosa alosa]|uniref:fatty acyl-CoA hydrolase precursor, medium chain-like n=1 Tax=Alosa alosa TaxID=278164 RepID=UPI0020155516|nr:fatty acyl-CoA hydrolase precursor, medium chain-like [Alosa alosa]
MKPVCNLVLIACVLHLTLSKVHNGPVLHTKLGVLRGDYMRVRGKTTVVHAYLGVPFAKPPVGNLRLAPPQPLQEWEGVRDATQLPPMCVQDKSLSDYLIEMAGMVMDIPEVSEDCLYVNVYTPAQPAKDAKLPVMVWIHGGGFSMGCASTYDGSVLAAYQNVVVVTIQYRLGMLGFFSTGDENAPGNLGLLDQVAALQWVQKNIHSFGGDPSSVTIFGESAGGVSVSLLVLSPLSTGLFHRAIAESGTAAMVTIINTDPVTRAKIVANATNCEGAKPDQIVDRVMRMSAEDIVKFQQEHPEVRFEVVNDGYFLPKAVPDLLKSHEFKKVPLINGVNNHECGWILPGFMASPDWVDGMDCDSIKPFVDLFYPNPDSKISTTLIMNEYLGNGEDRIKNRDGFTEFCGDILFTIPAITISNAHRDAGAPVFTYEFQHPPSMLVKKRPSFVRADHGDEIAFVFGGCFFYNGLLKLNGSFTEEEDELCRTMMAYWGNFARTGSPNGPSLTHWPAYGAGEEYLGIGLRQQVGHHLKADRYAFMTRTLPEKIQEMKQSQQRTEL